MRSQFSLHAIRSLTSLSIRRFPIEVLVAVIGTIAAIMVLHEGNIGFSSIAERLLTVSVFCSAFLLAAQLSISILHEHERLSKAMVWTLRLLATALAFIVLVSIDLDSDATPIELLTLFVTSHALTALAPFRRGAVATWNFNRALLLRMCLALVFTGVLIGGLLLAMGAIAVLFTVDIPSEYYADVAIFLIGIFNTLFVLAGVPEPAQVEQQTEIPRALRWFAQFVLIPLVCVFLVILYAYGVKVVFVSELNGAVANYILTLGVGSLLAWVLAWPLRRDPEHRIVSLYVRWLGVTLIPMVVLLTVAIGVRIFEYGITPPRFAVAVLTSFLIIVTVYLSLWRSADIRMIPAILCAIGMLTSLGPLGSANVSLRDQRGRAIDILTQGRVWNNSVVDTAAFGSMSAASRGAWFDAVDAMSDIDTAAARSFVRSLGLGIPADDSPRARFAIVGLQRPTETVFSQRRLYELELPSMDTVGLAVQDTARLYALSLVSYKTTTFGTWTARVAGSTYFEIRDTSGDIVDTVDLAPVARSLASDRKMPMSQRYVISRRKRFTFVAITGTVTAGDGRVSQVDLNGLVLVR